MNPASTPSHIAARFHAGPTVLLPWSPLVDRGGAFPEHRKITKVELDIAENVIRVGTASGTTITLTPAYSTAYPDDAARCDNLRLLTSWLLAVPGVYQKS